MAGFSNRDKAAITQGKIGPVPSNFLSVGEFCEGGYKLHKGPHVPGAPGQPSCRANYEAKYDDTIGWTWCCPTGEPIPTRKVLVCYRGKCVEKSSLPPDLAGRLKLCAEGANVGDECEGVPVKTCVHDRDCPEGEVCRNGVCVPGEEPVIDGEGCEGGYRLSGAAISAGGGKLWTDGIIKAEHGWYRDDQAAGHWIWHKEHGYQRLADVHASIQGTKTLTKFEGGACRKGFQPKIIGGVTWCCPEDGGGNGGGGGGMGEEFTWSPEMREAIQRMMERFEEMLDRPYGLSEEERQAIINYYTSSIKGGERGRLQSMEDRLARMGMAGGGLELAETGRIQRGTREQVAGVTQGLAIDEIDKALMNYLQTTGMAQGLLGTLMGAETVPESLSAARRGEGLSQQQMILQYLSILMGGQSNAYWQAIMNYMGGGQGQEQGDIWDWLPYLMAGVF